MTSKDAVLNIAVNLGRVARYIETKKLNRVRIFLNDNIQYITQVETKGVTPNVKKSFEKAVKLGKNIEGNNLINVAEDFYTYANILTHRAHLFV